MKTPRKIVDGVWEVRTRVKLGGGVSLPLRMTVLQDGDGLALISPVPINDALADSIAKLGKVHTLIAPNLLHHQHCSAAVERYPEAKLMGPPGLARKRPDLQFHGEIATGSLSNDIDAVLVDGAIKLSEAVFLHKQSMTLVVTDLVFNMPSASGLSWLLLAALSRALGKVEQSRLLRYLTDDRNATRQSIDRILDFPFERVVPAHGDVVSINARAQLKAGLWWMRGETRRPAIEKT